MPALYLHGIPTSSDDWVEFLARTGGIAPDLIGFGRSGKGGHLDYSVEGITRFVERFLAEVQVDEVKLVAHDWGVAVALALAERHPERVERLVLCNAPPLSAGSSGRGWPDLAHVPNRRGPDGLDDAGDARAGAPPRVRPRGCVARLTGGRGVGSVRPGDPAGDPPARPVRGGGESWGTRARHTRGSYPGWRATTTTDADHLGRTRPLVPAGARRRVRRSPSGSEGRAPARRRSLAVARSRGRRRAGGDVSWRSSADRVRPSVRSPAAPGDSTRADSRARMVKRVLPTCTSAVIAAAYVIVAPRSEDLAAHLLRAKLYAADGWFGIWNNWWYAGHNLPGYSVLFPPAAALTHATARGRDRGPRQHGLLFDSLVRRRYGEEAWLGSLWFGVATAIEPVHRPTDVRVRADARGRHRTRTPAPAPRPGGRARGRDRAGQPGRRAVRGTRRRGIRRRGVHGPGRSRGGDETRRRRVAPSTRGAPRNRGRDRVVRAGARARGVFPEGGTEPFAFSALWPIVLISVAALLLIPKRDLALQAGVACTRSGASRRTRSRARSAATRAGSRRSSPARSSRCSGGPSRDPAVATTALVVAIAAPALPPVAGAGPGPANGRRQRRGHDGLLPTAHRRISTGRAVRRSGSRSRSRCSTGRRSCGAPVRARAGLGAPARHKYNDLFYGRPAHAGDVRGVAPSTRDPVRRGAGRRHRLLGEERGRADRPRAAVSAAGAAHAPLARVRGERTRHRSSRAPPRSRTLGPNYLQLQRKPHRHRIHPGAVQPLLGGGRRGRRMRGSPSDDFTTLIVRRPGPMRVAIRFSFGRIGSRLTAVQLKRVGHRSGSLRYYD